MSAGGRQHVADFEARLNREPLAVDEVSWWTGRLVEGFQASGRPSSHHRLLIQITSCSWVCPALKRFFGQKTKNLWRGVGVSDILHFERTEKLQGVADSARPPDDRQWAKIAHSI